MRASQLSLSNVFPAILLLGLLGMTARPASDPDLWWHLRTGQWIMETGHIPHSDPFSFTRAGSPWISHEWLSEVAFYEIWIQSGEGGLIVFAAIVTTAGFMLLYLRSPGKPQWAAAAVTLGALAAAPTSGVRPQMFTFTLASLLLWLLDRGQERPRLLIWIPFLFLLWLNLHAGFALGPVLLVAYGTGLVWEVVVGDTRWQEARPYFLRILLVLIACLALVPLNPSGAQLYRYPLDVLRSAAMRSVIIEWFPPNFHQLRYLPLFLTWLALLWALSSSQSRPKARVLVPLFLTLIAALDAVRHIPLFVLLATPVISGAFAGRWSRVEASSAVPLSSAPRLRLAFRWIVLVLMAGFALTRWGGLIRNQARTEAELYPTQAIEFLRSRKMPSRLFVYYDWGGYAIWKLYPDYRVFVDGRADLYGDDLLHQFQEAGQLRDGWEQVLDRWGVQAVLVSPSSALAQGLLLDPRWGSEYRDSKAILFVLASQFPHENGRVIKNLCRQGIKVKKCVPEPSESAKLHQTGPVSASEHGHEAAVLVQATNDTMLDSAFACNRPVGLAPGVERLRSIPNFDLTLEACDERSCQTAVAQ